jgi:hypothetical protein
MPIYEVLPCMYHRGTADGPYTDITHPGVETSILMGDGSSSYRPIWVQPAISQSTLEPAILVARQQRHASGGVPRARG